MKKVRVIFLAVIMMMVFGLCACDNTNTDTENTNTNTSTSTEKKVSNEVIPENGKTLVVYYSATQHTKKVAEEIANKLNADTFEIVPVEIYTDDDLNWMDNNSRTSKEHKDASLRNVELVSTEVPNWDSYDTVFIGYPIWFGIAAWPTNSFVKAVDFGNKTVIPFCTSHSAGLGQSAKELQKDATGGNWQNGKRFEQDVDLSEVDNWVTNLSSLNAEEETTDENSRQMPPDFDENSRPPFDGNMEGFPEDFKDRPMPSGDFKNRPSFSGDFKDRPQISGDFKGKKK